MFRMSHIRGITLDVRPFIRELTDAGPLPPGQKRQRSSLTRNVTDWDLTEHDLSSFERAQRIWFDGIDRQQLAAEWMPDQFPHDERWRTQIVGSAHHTGTTRMHRDRSLGVVDEHCRVHGTSNIDVAGSSVFPTAGGAPPTLTSVALALRLADQIKARLAGTVSPRT